MNYLNLHLTNNILYGILILGVDNLSYEEAIEKWKKEQ